MISDEEFYGKIDKIDSECRWSDYFFELCDVIAKKSKDPSTKVGCVIVNSGHSIASTGYNGFPVGVIDNLIDFSDENSVLKKSPRYVKPQKYLWTAHAEENAIAIAARNGVSLNGTTLYVNRMIPCARCTRLIIQSGIKKVYVVQVAPQETIDRWKEEHDVSITMMEEAGVDLFVIEGSGK